MWITGFILFFQVNERGEKQFARLLMGIIKSREMSEKERKKRRGIGME